MSIYGMHVKPKLGSLLITEPIFERSRTLPGNFVTYLQSMLSQYTLGILKSFTDICYAQFDKKIR